MIPAYRYAVVTASVTDDQRYWRDCPTVGTDARRQHRREPCSEANIDIRGASTFHIATGHRDPLAAEAGLAAADLYGCGLEVIATETVNRPEAVGWNVEALPFWDGAGVSLYGRAWPTEADEDWARQGLVSVEWRLYRL